VANPKMCKIFNSHFSNLCTAMVLLKSSQSRDGLASDDRLTEEMEGILKETEAA
jgi:hypothetical protein